MSLHTFIAEALPTRISVRGAAHASAVPMQNAVIKEQANGVNAMAAANNDGAPPGAPMH